MGSGDSTNKSIWIGVAAAVAASLCCITPVLGVLAGIGGIASTFSWLDPARPYLIAATLGILGLAWYKKLAPDKDTECACETDEKQSLFQTKTFLGIVTIAALLLLTFPYYSGVFFQKQDKQTVIVERENLMLATLHIQGMTCSGCEQSVNKALLDKPGIIESKSDHTQGLALVKYDRSKVTRDDFIQVIEHQIGYKIEKIEVSNQ